MDLFDVTFNSYVFACAFPWFLPSTMLHLAVCSFAKLCPKREAVLGQYCIFIRRSSRHPARPIPKQLTFEQFENIILRFRILEKNLKISNFRKKNLKIQIFEEMKRWFQNVANFITVLTGISVEIDGTLEWRFHQGFSFLNFDMFETR